MTLMEILDGLAARLDSSTDIPLTSVAIDSRRVAPGTLFVAIRGEHVDGSDFVLAAQAAGAAAIVSERPRPDGVRIPWAIVPDARRAAAILSARVHGDPSARLTLAGITGTNGKTTVATLLEGVFSRALGSCGFLGTTQYRWGAIRRPAARTTPEAPELTEMLADMVDGGTAACAMEVSSHALALERVAGLRFDVTVFTNLTQDHFDFHRDFEGYFSAKRQLFDLRKPGAPGVVNADDPYGRRLLAQAASPVMSFSLSGAEADYRVVATAFDLAGTRLTVEESSGSHDISSPLVGRFNGENLLAAWAAARALAIPAETVAAALAATAGPPGRLEPVDAGQPFPIFVDYAHTEDALRRLLAAVRELTDRRIVLVFGCGGDRDPGKRVPMGSVASELADLAIATSDNPRGEDPAEIVKEVEKGLEAGGKDNYRVIVDRREAIGAAVAAADERSVLLIAGKGHETTQIIGRETTPFDDRVVAAEFARARRNAR